MGTTLAEKIAQLEPDHQAEIAAEAERLRNEYLTLRNLCDVRGADPQAREADGLGWDKTRG